MNIKALSHRRRVKTDQIWANVQADLSLRWAYSHFVGFAMRRLSYDNILIIV